MKRRCLIVLVSLMLFVSSCSSASKVKTDTPSEQPQLPPVATEEKPTIEIPQNNTKNIQSLEEITADNASKLTEIMSLGNGLMHDVSYSIDGKQIVVSTSIGVFIYESGTLKLEHYFETENSIGTIAISPDNRTVAVSSGSMKIHFFDIQSKAYLGNISYVDQTIYGFAFVNQGSEFVTAETGESIHYWDVATLAHSRSFTVPLTYTISFAASADGKLLAIETYKDDLIHIWDGDNGVELLTFSKPENFDKVKMTFSPDQKLLLAGHGSRLLAWSIETGGLQSDLSNYYEDGSLFFTSFSTNGDNFLTFSSDKVDLWNTSNFSVVTSVPFNLGSKTLCAASTSNNDTVVVGSLDGSLTTYNIASGQKITSVTNHMSVFTSVAISPDARLLAAGDVLGRIHVFDLQSNKLIFLLEDHKDEIIELVFSTDGKMLASLGEDEKVLIWDLSSGSKITSIYGFAEEIETIDFSPDGTILASGSFQDEIFLLDAQNGTVIKTINEGGNVSLDFSPDGAYIAATDLDNDISVWTINGDMQYLTRIETGLYGSSIIQFGLDNVIWAAAETENVGINIWRPYLEAQNAVQVPHNSYAKDGFKFSPDAQILAYHSGISITLLNTNTGVKIKDLVAFKMSDIPPYNFVSSYKFSENGKLLVAASEGGTISIWGIQ